MKTEHEIYSTHLLMEECATPGCIVEGPHHDYDCETMPADNIWRDEHWGEYWGRSICRGYLPMWSWLHRRFEWLPSDALLSEWIERGEIG